MRVHEAMLEANKIIKSKLSPELLMHCSNLLMDSTVSCDGLILLLKELSNEIDKIERE